MLYRVAFSNFTLVSNKQLKHLLLFIKGSVPQLNNIECGRV